MKILLLLEAALGGTGRHILDLAEGLLGRNHEVHLVYSPLRADKTFGAGLERLRQRAGFHCQPIAMTRAVTASDLRSYLELARYVKRHGGFDVLHAHSTKAGFLGRLLWLRKDARIVYTPHGLMTMDPELTGLRRKLVSVLESALSWRCHSVIAVSRKDGECAIQTGISPRKLVMIPNGLDPRGPAPGAREKARASLGLADDVVCIGSAGLLVPNKETARLLDAFAALRRRTSRPVRLAVIGWGPLEAKLREQARNSGIEADVQFLGQTPAEFYMPAFDIFAHASRYEAFPYVFLEALICGVPVVTTDVGGADELITAGITGFLCDPWDCETFASYLHRLAESPALRLAIGVQARNRAAQFTKTAMIEATLRQYGNPEALRRPSRNAGSRPLEAISIENNR